MINAQAQVVLDTVHMTVFHQSYVVSAGALADTFFVASYVESRWSFLERFLQSSCESNETFLGAANVISRPVTCQVLIAGEQGKLYRNIS